MAERIFELAGSDRGTKLLVNDSIDVLQAISRMGMPPEFYAERLIRAEQWLSDERERFGKLISGAASSRQSRRSIKNKRGFRDKEK